MSVGKTHRVSPSAGNVTMTCRTVFAVVLKLMFVVLIVAVIGGVAAAQSVSLSEATTRQSWAGCENWLNVSAVPRFGCVDGYMNRKEATTVVCARGEGKRGGDIRIVGLIDDFGWRVFVPMTLHADPGRLVNDRATRTATRTVCHAGCHAEIDGVR
jgi:hypothetical protein